MELIQAILKDEALIKQADQLDIEENRFHLWWLGQSGYLLQWNGYRILIDPYLSDSLTIKYAATSKPHIRMGERVIRPELLKGISIVSSSHNHTDHLDKETLVPVLQNNPGITFVIPEANREFIAARLGCDPGFPMGLSDHESLQVGPFTYHGIAAKHNEIERDSRGNCVYMGYVIQFGNFTIYHSGDTLWYDEMVPILKAFSVDVALLPINGNDPARGVAGNLDGYQAALLGKSIGAKMVIPCHYDMFTFNTADPEVFATEARKLGQPYKILKLGEMTSFPN
ncbi:MAG: MBL fold metallo-hydrolase [Bacteroidota bacterium]|nr:MBL fold metallo-hydrolase [Bacteroidota bacterium]